jgi:hypothetical protein
VIKQLIYVRTGTWRNINIENVSQNLAYAINRHKVLMSKVDGKSLNSLPVLNRTSNVVWKVIPSYCSAARSAHATMALDLLFSKPIFSSTNFSAQAKIPKATAARLLKVLEHEGVIALTQAGQGREAGVYAFKKYIGTVWQRTNGIVRRGIYSQLKSNPYQPFSIPIKLILRWLQPNLC